MSIPKVHTRQLGPPTMPLCTLARPASGQARARNGGGANPNRVLHARQHPRARSYRPLCSHSAQLTTRDGPRTSRSSTPSPGAQPPTHKPVLPLAWHAWGPHPLPHGRTCPSHAPTDTGRAPPQTPACVCARVCGAGWCRLVQQQTRQGATKSGRCVVHQAWRTKGCMRPCVHETPRERGCAGVLEAHRTQEARHAQSTTARCLLISVQRCVQACEHERKWCTCLSSLPPPPPLPPPSSGCPLPTLPTASAVKLGLLVNLAIFFSSASSSLSLSNSIIRFMKEGSPSCFLDSSQVAGRLQECSQTCLHCHCCWRRHLLCSLCHS